MMATHELSKPRIMFITSPDGGLAHYVVHLWEEISKFTDPIFVTYASSEPDELVQLSIENIYRYVDPDNLDSINQIVELATQFDVRILNLHVGTRVKLYIGYFLSLLSRFHGIGVKVIIHLHDVATHNTVIENSRIIQSLATHADAILTGSTQERLILEDILGNSSIPLGSMCHGPYTMLDRNYFVDSSEARTFLGLDENAPVILSFGALRDEKRLEDLIQAFEKVRSIQEDALLLIHSDIAYNSEKRAWLDELNQRAGVTIIIGYASLQTVEALFKAADVVALPYERAAASGVLNLARAFLRPVVLSDSFEQAADIDGVCGYSVPAKNPELLSDGLLRVLTRNAENFNCLGEGWNLVMEAESWHSASMNLIQLWMASVGGKAEDQILEISS